MHSPGERSDFPIFTPTFFSASQITNSAGYVEPLKGFKQRNTVIQLTFHRKFNHSESNEPLKRCWKQIKCRLAVDLFKMKCSGEFNLCHKEDASKYFSLYFSVKEKLFTETEPSLNFPQ